MATKPKRDSKAIDAQVDALAIELKELDDTKKLALNTPNSIKDLGYRVASTVSTLETQARWAMVHIAGIVEGKVSTEDRAAYDSGTMLKFAELNPDQKYIITKENMYIPATVDAMADLNPNHIIATLNIYTCMGESQQAYGKHKESSPSLHAIYGEMRTAWSNYRGKAWAALTSKVKELSEGKAKRIAQANDFEVRCSKGFDEWDKGVKNAFKRGDHTAIESRYLASKAAFWASWKSYKA
jgi:hypothetical protein